MGYNTGLVIMNDAMYIIERHPDEFVKNLNIATYEIHRQNKPVDVRVNGYMNAATVFYHDHSSTTGICLIGGNYGKVIDTIYHDPLEIDILKHLAEKNGYYLRKKK